MFLPPRNLDSRLAWLNGARAMLVEVVSDPKGARRLLREIDAQRQQAMDAMDRRANYRDEHGVKTNGDWPHGN